MVGGVAGHKFIEECGRDGAGKASYEADSGTVKVGLGCGERCPLSQIGAGLELKPRIVDITECQDGLVGEVVIDTDQLFAPVVGRVIVAL